MKPTDLDDLAPLEPDDCVLSRVRARSKAFRRRRTSRRLANAVSGLLVVVLAVALAVARSGTANERVTTPGPTTTTTTTATALSLRSALVGPWEPVSITGYAGPLVGEIRFGDGGSWSGDNGCNSAGGTYQLGPTGTFHLAGGPRTLRGCTDAKTGREIAMPLPYAATDVEIANDQLTFLAADRREIAMYKRANISTRVVLPELTIRAGSSMSARVIVDNETGHALPVVICESYFQIALGNAKVHPEPAWRLCAENFTFPVGESSYPVIIDASYLGCATDGPQGSLPQCLPGGNPPPLPPGAYQAQLFQSGDVVPEPPPITVQVTPACATNGSGSTPPRLPASAGIASLPGLTQVSSSAGALPSFKGGPGSSRSCYAPVAGLSESWLLAAAIAQYGSAAKVPVPIPLSIASNHPGGAEVNLTVLVFADSSQPKELLADPEYNANPGWTTVPGQPIRDGNLLKVDSLANGGLSEFIVQRVDGDRWIDVSVVGADLTVAEVVRIAESVGTATHR